MIDFVHQNLFQSPFFVLPVLSVIVAQIIKTIIFWIEEKKFTPKYLLTDGGTVSGHSSIITSITVTIFLVQGFSALFFFACVVSFIIFRDAYGVRFESGRQAEIINDVVKRLKIKEGHLKELIGHTKRQVFFGFLNGLLITILGYILFF